MRYNFLYTSDSNYFNYMYLSIYSLLKNNDYPLTIHIIESGFTKEQNEKLEKLFNLYSNATLKMYSIDKLKSIMDKYSIPKWKETDIANARLFSSKIIDVDKILYIDSDTIVTSSLKDVFNTNISSPISAVREMNVPSHLSGRLESYYNSGVLLIDYRICDEIDLLRRLFDTLNKASIQLIYPDQDLLNLTLSEQIGTLLPEYNINPLTYDMVFNYPIISKKYLEERFNTFYKMEELIKSYQNPRIYHLLQYIHTRPWIKNNVHVFNEIYDEYSKDLFGVVYKIKQDDEIYSILCSMNLFKTISVILEVTSLEERFKIKDKVKKIIYFNRK